MPIIHPIILTFGLPANYFAHLVETIHGNEVWRPTKIILPLNILTIVMKWGLIRGALLSYGWMAILGLWYFTMALMNHNAEHCMDVDARNKARDWGGRSSNHVRIGGCSYPSGARGSICGSTTTRSIISSRGWTSRIIPPRRRL